MLLLLNSCCCTHCCVSQLLTVYAARSLCEMLVCAALMLVISVLVIVGFDIIKGPQLHVSLIAHSKGHVALLVT